MSREKFEKSVLLFGQAGWPLIRIAENSKQPIAAPKGSKTTGWEFATVYKGQGDIAEKHYNAGGNFGIRLDIPNQIDNSKMLVLDVDVHKEKGKVGEESYKRLRKAWPQLPKPHVQTPSGGTHTYFRLPSDIVLPRIFKQYPDIDFLCGRKFALIPGSIFQGKQYKWIRPFSIEELPDKFLDTLLNDHRDGDANGDGKTGVKKESKANDGVQPPAIADMLGCIDVELYDKDYDGWVKIGMALHSYSDSIEMRDMWYNWSMYSPKYSKDSSDKVWNDINTKWKSFDAKGGVTIKHLRRHALKGMRRRFAIMLGKTQTVYDLKNKKDLSPASFNVRWARVFSKTMESVVRGHADSIQDAVEYVDGSVCAPGMPDIFEFDGSRLANEWSKDRLPKPADEVSDAAKKQCVFIDNHLRALCPDDDISHDALRRWIAHQVQFPGKKIGWVPVLLGIQGTGKSSVVKLITLLIGGHNVKTSNARAIVSDFNDGAIGAQVISIEDFNPSWKQKTEFNGTMKDLVTDPAILKHEKGKNRVKVPNPANYIMCSNDYACLIISPTERRWLPLSRGCETLFEFVGAAQNLGRDAEMDEMKKYYNRLAEILDINNPLRFEIIKWFMDMPNVDKLCDDYPQAPKNAIKESMGNDGGNLVDMELRSILKEGGRNEKGVYGNNVAMLRAVHSELNRRLAADDTENKPGEIVSQQRVSNRLKSFGWVMIGDSQIRFGKFDRQTAYARVGVKDGRARIDALIGDTNPPLDDEEFKDEVL